MKRAYGRIKIHEKQIIEMRQEGKTRQEIADELGLKKEQIKECVKRYNKRIAADATGLPAQRSRKPAVTLAEYKYECRRLKMENELLRDFLWLAGRR